MNLWLKSKKIISIALVFAMLFPCLTYGAEWNPEEGYLYLEENTMPQEIQDSDLFYVGTNSANLYEEGSPNYLFKIGRGGEALEAASVTLKISDVTAKYGQDYKIKIHDNKILGETVYNPADNQSLREAISEAEIEETALPDEETLAEMIAEQATGQEMDGEDAAAFFEEERKTVMEDQGSEDQASDDQGREELSDPAIEAVEAEDTADVNEEGAIDSGTETDRATDESLNPAEENNDDGTAQTEEKNDDGTEEVPDQSIDSKSLSGAKQLFTGIESDRTPMTSSQDMVEQMQQMADLMTTSVKGASLKVDFLPGEKEKYVEIIVKDNNRSDGERIFMIILSETTGTTTNSMISNAMFTIVDDEEPETAQVYFNVESFDADQEKAVVEVYRKGDINSFAGATLQTEDITAASGRDYSPVKASVVFPFGVEKRTLEIPVNTEFVTTTAEFKVKLTDPVSAELTSDEAVVTLYAPKAALNEAKGDMITSLAVTPSTYRTGKAIDLSWVFGTDKDGGDSTSHYKDGKYSLGGCDWANANWMIDPNKNRTEKNYGYNHWDYSGIEVDWKLDSGKPAYERTKFDANIGDTTSSKSWTGLMSSSTERWSRVTDKYYFSKKVISSVHAYNAKTAGFWGKKGTVTFYSIKPILRPFEVSFQAADSLKFYDEYGNQTAVAQFTTSKLENTESDGKAVLFSGDKIQVTATNYITNDSGQSIQVAKLVGVDLVKGTARKRVGTSSNGQTISINLTNSFIENNLDYIDFVANGKLGLKGKFTVKPVFEYYPAKIRVYKEEKGYLKVTGGNNFNIFANYQNFTYHIGDTIQLSSEVQPLYTSDYRADGVKYAYKENALNSATSWGTWGFDKKSNTAKNYLIRNEYTEITPSIVKKDNQVTVRVAKSDFEKFNQNFGIFNPLTSASKVSNGNYWDYTVVNKNDVQYKMNYSFQAKALNSGDLPIWKEVKTGKSFSGNVFYFNTWDTKESNVIELSLSSTIETYDMSGTMYFNDYNLATKRSGTAWLPASGGIISANGGSSIIGDDGKFTTTPFVGVKNTYMRYLASCNGKNVYHEYMLPSSGTKKSVTVKVTETDGTVTEKTYNVLPLTIGNVIIPADNENRPNVSTVSATNSGQLSGTTVYINDTATKFTATISDDGIGYLDSQGNEKKETVTDVKFLVYDSKTNACKLEIPAAKISGLWTANQMFELAQEGTAYGVGDKIFVQITTDRPSSDSTANYDDQGNLIKPDPETEKAMKSTIYSPVNSGLVLVSGAAKEPVTQSFSLPTKADFVSLPLIGDFNSTMNISNLSLTITDLGGGVVRLQAGYIIKNKKTQSDNKDRADNAKDYNAMSFKSGIKESFNDAFKGDKSYDSKKLKSSLGAQQWGIYPIVGLYIDFGIAEVTLENGTTESQFEFMGGGVFLGGTASYKVAWYALIPAVFIPCYFGVSGELTLLLSVGAEASADSELTFDSMETTSFDLRKEFKADVVLLANATVQIYAGVGLCGTIGVRGGAQMDASLIYYPTVTNLYPDYHDTGLALYFSLRIWVDALLFSIPVPVYNIATKKYGYFQDVDSHKAKSLATQETAESSSEPGPGIQIKEFGDEPSEWLPGGNRLFVQGGFTQDISTTLVENGYDRPDSQLLSLGDGKTLLVFLDQDNKRSSLEKTVLKYSVFDGSQWMEPVVIQEDGTADFMPNLCDAGDHVLISWVSSEPEKEDNENKTSYLLSMDIYTVLLDKATLELEDIQQLTNDDYYDSEPHGIYDDKTGDMAVFYIKTDRTPGTDEDKTFIRTVDPTSNDCVITYMLYDGEEERWLTDKYYDNEVADPEDIPELVDDWNGQRFLSSPISDGDLQMVDPLITDFTSISYNGIGVYAYTVDKDNSKDTNMDRDLFVQIYDFETHKTYKPIRITYDSVSDSMPQMVRRGTGEDAATYLFWLCDDSYVEFINISDLVKNGIENDGTIKSDYERKQGIVTINPSLDSEEKYSLGTYKAAVDNDGNLYIVWQETVADLEKGTSFVELYATGFIESKLKAEAKTEDELFEERVSEDPDEEPGEGGVITEPLDFVGGSWSPAYRLTYSERFNDEASVTIDENGKLIVVHDQYDLEYTDDSERPVIITNLALKATVFVPCGSVETTGIEFSNSRPQAGDTIQVSATVENRGLTVAEGYSVSYYLSEEGALQDTIYSASSDKQLVPGGKDIITFDWEVPENFAGKGLTAISEETGLSGTHSYTSDILQVKPYYEITNEQLYQGDGGFYGDFTVTNTGNGVSRPGDTLQVTYNLPYTTADKLGIQEEVFAKEEISQLMPGDSIDLSLKLNIPAESFDKYGFMGTYTAVTDKDEKLISNELDTNLPLSMPAEIKILADNKAVSKVSVRAGESVELSTVFAPTSRFNKAAPVYGTANTDVAYISGNTLTGTAVGTTTLTVVVAPYGAKVDIPVNVTPTGGGGGGDSQPSVPSVPVVIPEPTEEATFNDISGHWAQKAIIDAAAAGILKGYEDGSFKPDGTITRAEFLTILYNSKLIDLQTETDVDFIDVNANLWYYTFARWGAAMGITHGYDDGTFRGDSQISREEMAVMLSKFIDLMKKQPEISESTRTFRDEQNIAAWAADPVAKLVAMGIIHGNEQGDYMPKGSLTRAESATIIMALYNSMQDNASLS